MKQLLLMRHAKSSWAEAGLSDFDRGLKSRGERNAIRMGQHLNDQHLVPSHVVSSTAKRARATADLVVDQFPNRSEIELRDELYHALPAVLVRVIQSTDEKHESLLLIAHNPGLEELVYQWSATIVTFVTAAIVHFSFPIERWADLDRRRAQSYEHVWKPKDLDAHSD